MKNRIFILILCLSATALSCSTSQNWVTQAFTFCYVDTLTYTGIDTLIDITGYYSNPENNLRRLIFYDNGLVVSRILEYNKIQWSNEKTENIPLYLKNISDSPTTKGSFYYDLVDCGRYTISGDTIKAQIVHKSYSLNDGWSGYERWYRIIDKNTLQCIKVSYLTTNKREIARMEINYSLGVGNSPEVGQYNVFVSAEKIPPSNYYWIFNQKWFWCNEQDWRNYMEKMKEKEVK